MDGMVLIGMFFGNHREETIDFRLDDRRGIDKERFPNFIRTGRLENLEWLFDDEEPILNGLEMFT
jgi:hypothetical protein